MGFVSVSAVHEAMAMAMAMAVAPAVRCCDTNERTSQMSTLLLLLLLLLFVYFQFVEQTARHGARRGSWLVAGCRLLLLLLKWLLLAGLLEDVRSFVS